MDTTGYGHPGRSWRVAAGIVWLALRASVHQWVLWPWRSALVPLFLVVVIVVFPATSVYRWGISIQALLGAIAAAVAFTSNA